MNKAEAGETLKLNGLVCYESIYPDFVAAFISAPLLSKNSKTSTCPAAAA